MSNTLSRRSFVKNSLLSSASLALSLGATAQEQKPAAAASAPAPVALPKAKIGKLEISRLILGGN